jgi:hypothetical protein
MSELLKCPEKFYLCAAYADNPPQSVNAITMDSKLLLFALHEQATKGRAKDAVEPRPGFLERVLGDGREAIERFRAWEMLGDMPAICAMERYCEEVEAFNPEWFREMTKGLDFEGKTRLLTMADSCAEEYYLMLSKGMLVNRRGSRSRGSGGGSGDDGRATTTPTDIRTFGSVIFSTASATSSGNDGIDNNLHKQKSRFMLEKKMPERNEWRTIVVQPALATSASSSSNGNNSNETDATNAAREKFPQKRFGHVAHKIGDELVISHGNKDGRLLSDCWALDLMELRWKKKELKWPGAPCADAASVATEDTGEIYLFRGVGSSDETNVASENDNRVTISKLDLSDIGGKFNLFKWHHVKTSTSTDLPRARTGHTATLFENDDVVYVFGGMSVGDAKKNIKSVALNDLWEFSLITKTWRQIRCDYDEKKQLGTTTTTTTSSSPSYVQCEPPTARGSHVAGRCGRFLIIFGGAAGNILSDVDVHCFDTRTYRWVKVLLVPDSSASSTDGITIAPRAGHCSATSEDSSKMYICGGGNNESAIFETLQFDLAELSRFSESTNSSSENSNNDNNNKNTNVRLLPKITWSVLVNKSSLTGKEGMTITTIACESGEYLLAFGGLSGLRDDFEVSCLRTK